MVALVTSFNRWLTTIQKFLTQISSLKKQVNTETHENHVIHPHAANLPNGDAPVQKDHVSSSRDPVPVLPEIISPSRESAVTVPDECVSIPRESAPLQHEAVPVPPVSAIIAHQIPAAQHEGYVGMQPVTQIPRVPADISTSVPAASPPLAKVLSFISDTGNCQINIASGTIFAYEMPVKDTSMDQAIEAGVPMEWIARRRELRAEQETREMNWSVDHLTVDVGPHAY